MGFAGQSVVVVEVRRAKLAAQFLELLERFGARLAFWSAQAHDRHTALLQAATHAAILALGICLRELQYDLGAMEAVMPPPHRAMVALLARIACGSPEVYWDIQTANHHAPKAREALARGVDRLTRLAEAGDQAGFGRLMTEIGSLFDPESQTRFCSWCAAMLQVPKAP